MLTIILSERGGYSFNKFVNSSFGISIGNCFESFSFDSFIFWELFKLLLFDIVCFILDIFSFENFL